MAAMGAVGTLFSIVDLTSSSTAAQGWHLWRKAKSGKVEDRIEVTSHLALDVLAKPNNFYGRRALMAAGQQHVDLTGENAVVIATNPLMPGVPTGLWIVRPDRITPVPSAEHFLAGYVYTGPDGEKIPLDLDQVMRIVMPNPLDPYRGLGPVQSILADADSVKYSVEWNRQFFLNGAEPGGIIEIDGGLLEQEFQDMRRHWAEQHRGGSNAHRVAIIESGHWVDRKYSHTDMGFAQLREVSRDSIREAFRVHGHMLGDADDVNLANATAAEITFARRLTVPRLDRWKGLLNRQFLPKFKTTAVGLEFDYDNPVAEDEAQDSLNFLNWARGLSFLVASGFNGKQAVEKSGLGDIEWDQASVVHGNTTQAAGIHDNENQQPTGPAPTTGWDSAPANRALPAGGGDVYPKA